MRPGLGAVPSRRTARSGWSDVIGARQAPDRTFCGRESRADIPQVHVQAHGGKGWQPDGGEVELGDPETGPGHGGGDLGRPGAREDAGEDPEFGAHRATSAPPPAGAVPYRLDHAHGGDAVGTVGAGGLVVQDGPGERLELALVRVGVSRRRGSGPRRRAR